MNALKLVNGERTTKGDMSSDTLVERTMIASLFCDPIGAAIAIQQLSEQHFRDPQCREMFHAISSTLEAGQDIDLGTVFRRMRQGTIAQFSAIAYPDDDPQIAPSLEALKPVVQARANLEGKAPASPALARKCRLIQLAHPPKQDVTLYTVNGSAVCTEGNLTTITAAAKSGKSATCSAMVSAVVTTRPMDADTLGFRSRNPEGRAVIYLDCEQSPHDAWQLVDRMRRRARAEAMPPWFFCYSLAGLSPHEALQFARDAFADARDECGGIHSLIVDGAADLVNDPNDAGECNPLVAELHDMAIRNSCCIVSVIHFNPGTEKARGHLGSQLERKSESNLRLEKDGEAVVLYSEKQRRAPILKERGPRFAWSDEAGMHVSVGSVGEERRSAVREAFGDVFGSRPAMTYCELKTTVMQAMTVKDRQAEKKIAEAVKAGVITKSAARLYALAR